MYKYILTSIGVFTLILIASQSANHVLYSQERADKEESLKVTLNLTYGQYGGVRSSKVTAGEVLFISYTIRGLQQTTNKKVNFSIKAKFIDPAGAVLAEQPADIASEISFLGNESITSNKKIRTPSTLPPGRYQYSVTVVDQISSKETTANLWLNIAEPSEFAAINININHGYTNRAENDLDIGNSGSQVFTAGEAVQLNYNVVGFTSKDKKMLVKASLNLLDSEKKQSISDKLEHIFSEGPESVEHHDNIRGIPAWFYMTLNRPGKFYLRLHLIDEFSKKEINYDIPVIVFEPIEAFER